MITSSQSFADAKCARDTLKKLYPEAKNITLVEHGYDNIVGLVDEMYAIRFSRNEGAYKRSLYEKTVLKDIDGLQDIATPHVIGDGTNPYYLVTSFLHGSHLSPQEICDFTPEQQQTFGEDVATFAYKLHSALSVEDARKAREQLGLDNHNQDPWPVYLEKTLTTSKLPTLEQEQIATHYFERWLQYCAKGELFVIHDDLHNENMLFENRRLVGILDFADTTIGTPEQELRQLYRINEAVLLAAANMYHKLSGRKVHVEAAKTWAIVQELAAYARDLTNKNTDQPAFKRACGNLNKWFPQENWGEGYTN